MTVDDAAWLEEEGFLADFDARVVFAFGGRGGSPVLLPLIRASDAMAEGSIRLSETVHSRQTDLPLLHPSLPLVYHFFGLDTRSVSM